MLFISEEEARNTGKFFRMLPKMGGQLTLVLFSLILRENDNIILAYKKMLIKKRENEKCEKEREREREREKEAQEKERGQAPKRETEREKEREAS